MQCCKEYIYHEGISESQHIENGLKFGILPSYPRRISGPSSTSSTSRPQAPQQPAPHMPPLNWSHFRPKFSRKPEEDAEAHLLRTNNCMDTHRFQGDEKVQRFCLMLTGEARLWYESLRPINADWT